MDGNYGYLLPSTNHAAARQCRMIAVTADCIAVCHCTQIVLRFRLETFTFVDSLNLADSFPYPHALVNWWGSAPSDFMDT